MVKFIAVRASARSLHSTVLVPCPCLMGWDSSPNFPVAAIALLLIGAFIFLRLWSKARSSALPLG